MTTRIAAAPAPIPYYCGGRIMTPSVRRVSSSTNVGAVWQDFDDFPIGLVMVPRSTINIEETELLGQFSFRGGRDYNNHYLENTSYTKFYTYSGRGFSVYIADTVWESPETTFENYEEELCLATTEDLAHPSAVLVCSTTRVDNLTFMGSFRPSSAPISRQDPALNVSDVGFIHSMSAESHFGKVGQYAGRFHPDQPAPDLLPAPHSLVAMYLLYKHSYVVGSNPFVSNPWPVRKVKVKSLGFIRRTIPSLRNLEDIFITFYPTICNENYPHPATMAAVGGNKSSVEVSSIKRSARA